MALVMPKWLPADRSPKQLMPFLGAIIAGVLAIVLLVQVQQGLQLKRELQLAQRQVGELTQQTQSLTQQLDQSLGDRKRLGEQVETLRKQFGSAEAQLDAARRQAAELEEKFQQMSSERTELQTKFASLTDEHAQQQQRLRDTEEQKADLERSVTHLRQRLALLKRDYGRLQEQLNAMQSMSQVNTGVVSVSGPMTPGAAMMAQAAPASLPRLAEATMELPPIIVRKDQAGMMMPVRGRVVEVNDAHRFLVLDKGSEDGVRVGASFDLVRGSSTVGRARAVRVRPRLTACDVVKSNTPGPVHVGDLALERASAAR